MIESASSASEPIASLNQPYYYRNASLARRSVLKGIMAVAGAAVSANVYAESGRFAQAAQASNTARKYKLIDIRFTA